MKLSFEKHILERSLLKAGFAALILIMTFMGKNNNPEFSNLNKTI